MTHYFQEQGILLPTLQFDEQVNDYVISMILGDETILLVNQFKNNGISITILMDTNIRSKILVSRMNLIDLDLPFKFHRK